MSGGELRKLSALLLLSISLTGYSYTRMSVITEEAEKINKAEAVRTERLMKRKIKLENELSELQKNYNSRTEITEKLRMDSEVRWYRDEYREILKKYDTVQTDLEKEIEKREKELMVINSGLGLLNE